MFVQDIYTAFTYPDTNAVRDAIKPVASDINADLNPGGMVSGATDTSITDTTPVVLIAGLENQRVYITNIMVTNSDSGAGTFVTITIGTTVKWTGWAAPGGGFVVGFANNPLMNLAYNEAVSVECETNGADVRACISGYRAT